MSDQTVDRIKQIIAERRRTGSPTRRTTVTRRRRTTVSLRTGRPAPANNPRTAGQAWSRASAHQASGRCRGRALPAGDLADRQRGRQAVSGRRPRRRGRLRHHPGDQRRPEGAAPRRQRRRRGRRRRRHARRHRAVRRRHRRRRLLRLLRRARPHRVYTIDGRETAPAAADRTSSSTRDGQAAAVRDRGHQRPVGGRAGARSPTWQRALDRFGRCRAGPRPQARRAAWPSVASRSTDTFRTRDRENASPLRPVRRPRDCSCPADSFPMVGSIMRNPDLARTYQQIGRQGIGALYGGPIGADIVRTVHHPPVAPGAPLVAAPGRRWRSATSPLHRAVRRPDRTSTTGASTSTRWPPSSCGGSTVGEALNILGNFDLSGETRCRRCTTSSRRAARVRGPQPLRRRPRVRRRAARSRCCPSRSPAARLPDQCRRRAHQPGGARRPVAGRRRRAGGTADPRATQRGRSTPTTSSSPTGGATSSPTRTRSSSSAAAAITVPGRGFLLNNELTDFDFAPPQAGVPDPNLPAAGKRPRVEHVADDRAARRALRHRGRLAGGATIITTVLQILINQSTSA